MFVLLILSPKLKDDRRDAVRLFLFSFLFQLMAFIGFALSPLISKFLSLIIQLSCIAISLHLFLYGLKRYEHLTQPKLLRSKFFWSLLAYLQIGALFAFYLVIDNHLARLAVIATAQIIVYVLCISQLKNNVSRSHGNAVVLRTLILMMSALPILNLLSYILLPDSYYGLLVLTIYSLHLFIQFCTIIFMFLSDMIDENYKLAILDPLTGLFNRRHFYDKAQKFRNLNVGSNQVGLILCDVDNFKSINDIYGHSAGDTVIQEFGSVLTQSTRDGDIVARIGGEEFAIYVNNASLETCKELAERIRNNIKSTAIICEGNTISITASFGIAIVTRDAYEHGLKEADKAMYKAKELGKDRVCVAQ